MSSRPLRPKPDAAQPESDLLKPFKPSKVEKVKRNRQLKLKQGPPHRQTASAMRRFLRLYMFTKLSWETIFSLLIKPTDPKKKPVIGLRAMKYQASEAFGAHPNHVRPSTAEAGKTCALEIQRSRKSSKVPAQHVPTPYSTEDHSYLSYFDSETKDTEMGKMLESLSTSQTSRGSLISELSARINRLSDLSTSYKAFLKDLLFHSSLSTASSIRGSSSHRFSLRSKYSANSTPTSNYMQSSQATTSLHTSRPSDKVSDRHHFVSQSATHTSIPIISPQSDMVAPSMGPAGGELFFDYTSRSSSPSIPTSDDRHLICDASYKAPGYCARCILRSSSSNARSRVCLPFSIFKLPEVTPAIRLWRLKGVYHVDMFKNTSLHIAAAMGADYHEIQTLLRYGVDPSVLNSASQSFLHVINLRQFSLKEMYSLRESLEQRHFDFRGVDIWGRVFLDPMPFHDQRSRLFAQCWLEPLQLLDSFGGIINYQSLRRLFCGAGGSSVEWGMLSWPESALSWDGRKQEPFQFAYEKYRAEYSKVTSYILQETINYDIPEAWKYFTDKEGRNILQLAVIESTPQMRLTKSQKLVERKRLSEMLDRLVKAGVEVNHHDRYGETPLMTVVDFNILGRETTNNLLDAGANVNARNKNGDTALHFGIRCGNIEATEVIISRGGNLDARDQRGCGVLQKASKNLKFQDPDSYARINLCMVLAINQGAVAEPTLDDEWTFWMKTAEELRKRVRGDESKKPGIFKKRVKG